MFTLFLPASDENDSVERLNVKKNHARPYFFLNKEIITQSPRVNVLCVKY